ncbi:poly(3-hydroxybutyrate) depolymerase [Gemmobacter aquarius]|uniref:Poly(3-hydroxybutyrate) depolymerase n=1 Tax=Paragemmobacter aquarius TaxID=2169400 RepID=A0A2S0UPA3_9RHOB|nr:PHB depolymerase family esterase [Gemmobacter aquarius]AWB49643.1 poly(3-hydroxybutyrate) depolymerase [Gemmobacter aquarius]
MPDDFATAMNRARDLVRAGKPQEATRLIQATLTAQPALDATPDPVTHPRPAPPRNRKPRIDPSQIDEAELATAKPDRKRRPLGDVISGLTKNRPDSPKARATTTAIDLAAGARFDWRRLETPQGSRDYRLYVPSAFPDGPQGLILMLHGCTQSPDDFAAGTAMNVHAERHGLLLAYPAQTRSDNAQSCWNWFRPADQMRDRSEPAVLAAIARALCSEFSVPADRIFVAGLSAGGAMAAILGQTYPDLFSATAIHSGLAAGSATDVVSAFAAMRGDATVPARGNRPVRTITFHGSADTTVHPDNSAQIMALARQTAEEPLFTTGTANGRFFTRSQTFAPDGTVQTEHWEISGTGHAWSGGSPAGSYTDPKGPDASALAVGFFLGHAAEGT